MKLRKKTILFNIFQVYDKKKIAILTHKLNQIGLKWKDTRKLQVNDEAPHWSITAFVSIVPNEKNIDKMKKICSEVATECGAEYGGWYVTNPE